MKELCLAASPIAVALHSVPCQPAQAFTLNKLMLLRVPLSIALPPPALARLDELLLFSCAYATPSGLEMTPRARIGPLWR